MEVSHEGRAEESKQYHARQKEKKKRQYNKQSDKVSDKCWYELNGNKVIKRERLDNGNLVSSYVGKAKHFGHLIKG